MNGLHTSVILGGGFVDNGAVLQASEIEHANAAVLATADEYVDTISAESYIVDLLVMRNELGFGGQRRDVPDSASRIDARCDNQAWRYSVPIQRSQGRRVIRRFRVGE